MTAEIAILNKSAIVAAADSAVTVGRSKVHQHATKIFQICDATPLGFMVSGYAEYCGLPWETIAKLFRKEFGGTKFPTVIHCHETFRDFLARPRFFTSDSEKISLVLFANDVLTKLRDVLEDVPRKFRSRALRLCIQEHQKMYLNWQGHKLRFNAPALLVFRRQYANIVWAVTEQVFEEIEYKVPRTLRGSLTELVWHALASPFSSEYSAEIAVFGFGEDELLPAVVSEEIDGSCCGSMRTLARELLPISQQNDASIIPFADRSIMDVFMEGIDKRTLHFMSKLMQETAQKVAEKVIKDNFDVPPAEYNLIKKINDKSIKEIIEKQMKKTMSWIKKGSIDPVLNIVTGLPKEDMAALAEALVEVTALKTKVSQEVESVGGAVDVCVVTKSDGLIWIKRKHYFDLAKNYQYLYRRFGTVSIK